MTRLNSISYIKKFLKVTYVVFWSNHSCLSLTLSYSSEGSLALVVFKSLFLSALSAFRALLSSANYSAECSDRVWQPVAKSNGCLAHFFLNLMRAKQPNLTKLHEIAILICSGLLYPTGWPTQPSEDTLNHCIFFQGQRNSLRI